MKKQLFYLLLVFSFQNVFSQTPINGLIAYYPFNGNANDASGNNINPTVTGAKLALDRFGNQNSAYYFNGKTDYIQLTHDQSKISFKTDYTISLWYRIDTALNTNYTLFTSRHTISGGENGGLQIVGTNGDSPTKVPKGFNVQGVGSTCNVSVKDSARETKDWNNISFVAKRSKNTFYVYRNGVLADSARLTSCPTTADNSSPIIIGADVSSSHGWFSFFNGYIDDIRIYNRALSYTEVTSITNEGKCYEKVAVTDTLRIRSSVLAGLNDLPASFGTVKIYPNPTNDILNITVSNPSPNYTVKIANSNSQTVYTSVLNSQNTKIDLGTFASKGLFYIQILDNSNNVLETKKLILE